MASVMMLAMLLVEMTSKENLKIEWYPAGLFTGQPGPNCDWKRWQRLAGSFQRPSNELLFMRQVGAAARQLEVDATPLMENFQNRCDAPAQRWPAVGCHLQYEPLAGTPLECPGEMLQ